MYRSQGWICSDKFTCCHTEKEVAVQTFHLTQSQYTDTSLTSPISDPITPPGTWQGNHWSANFKVTGSGMSLWLNLEKSPQHRRESNPRSPTLETRAEKLAGKQRGLNAIIIVTTITVLLLALLLYYYYHYSQTTFSKGYLHLTLTFFPKRSLQVISIILTPATQCPKTKSHITHYLHITRHYKQGFVLFHMLSF